MAMLDVEVFIMVDADGNYVVHTDQSELEETYVDNVGANRGETPTRVIAVRLKVPTPTIIEVEATLPEQEESVVLAVK